ncbi:MAG: NADH-quinone oxidoreductase subunit H [Verrucomicrobiota bacterium JB022]|nr:NADH-quinone oxidoreductase subunit H [Verrucomicrobiota bacterium JB022]
MDWIDILLKVIYALVMVAVVMTIAGYSVLAERKIASWIQGRVGPNRTALPGLSALPVIGPMLVKLGIWQPLADGVKFLFKEDPIPGHVKKFYYVLAPMISLAPALITMVVLPFGVYYVDGQAMPLVLANVDIGILFILAVSSLGVYGIILAGWASNSKYPFLGGIRASAQMISYELAMGLALLPVFMWFAPETGGSLNLFNLVQAQGNHMWGVLPAWTIFYQPLGALIFLVSLFAETNRAPFDMPESETDLVAGFNTEYGAFKFGLFFLGEYTHIIIGSGVFVTLFLGGWNLPWITMPAGILGAALSILVFLGKTCALIFLFIWVRWTLPRFRYDQVMTLGWKKLLPLAVANFVLYLIIIALIEG